MDKYEQLIAQETDVRVVEKVFKSRARGLMKGRKIAIRKDIPTSAEKACVLAEELGHYHTTVGNILDPTKPSNRKQERRARLWGYNNMIGLYGLVNALENGCKSKHEVADYLEVTEEYLENAIKCYREIHGLYAKADNYIIYFEPSLKIIKMI